MLNRASELENSYSERFCVTVIRTPRYGGEAMAYVQAQAKGYCDLSQSRFFNSPATSVVGMLNCLSGLFMALRYRKRTGKKNNYSTTTRSSRGTRHSHTVKNGTVTQTTNQYGTRITSNLGGGWSNSKYIPNGRAANKRAMKKSMSQLRKMNRKRGASKLINPIHAVIVLVILHFLGVGR